NTLMPFIRYDQGDRVVYRNAVDDQGWRRLEKVIGRDNDIVVLSDGKKLQGHFFYKLLGDYQGIVQFRVIQKTFSEFEIYLQGDSEYIREIEKELIQKLKDKVGSNCDFKILQTDRILPEKNGKFRLLISEVA
ncbi:MAG: hypothetical protein IBX56_18460, partial [Methylomicrobium sp.]|nr:hypothetical protein [Methylomicrobium sp.]